MTFGDKLMRLRKKEGLSQEELGEKLNVTRQTVSKWELNQTIPDMNKLKEMSELFNVSVEYLTNDNNEIENNNVESNIDKSNVDNKKINNDELKPRKWLLIVLIIVAVIILVILLDKVVANKKARENKTGGLFETITEKINSNIDNVDDVFDKVSKESFNNTFEHEAGTKSGFFIPSTLDKIIKNNKKNPNNLVFLKYNDTNTSDPEEIKNLKQSFDSNKDYEVSVDYDEKGYVNLITIEDINKNSTSNNTTSKNTSTNSSSNGTTHTETNTTRSESQTTTKESADDWFERQTFNQKYEIYNNNTSYGMGIRNLINRVISDNNNGKHIITVNFNGSSSSNVATLNSFLSKIVDLSNYSVSVAYGSDNYVNSITIREV